MDGSIKTIGTPQSVLVLQGRQVAIKIGESTMILDLDKMKQLGILR
jgi:hypothetical protein